MRTLAKLLAALLCLFFVVAEAQQVTVKYQPNRYPEKKKDGTPMPQNLEIIHLWDGWIANNYPTRRLVRDDKLLVGGWGDNYRTYIRFDAEGLPYDVDYAALGLYSYCPLDGSTLVGFDMWKPTTNWRLFSMTWDTQPPLSYLGSWKPGNYESFWWMSMTNVYNAWKKYPGRNYGVVLTPKTTVNNFNAWYSSRYKMEEKEKRPVLYLRFIPSFRIKSPLPGRHYWLLTTEIGGYDCVGEDPTYWPDQAHMGKNYFSLDFSWQNIADPGAKYYSASSNIPVLAVAGGKVIFAGGGTTAGYPNGYYVVIDHDGDGNPATGFTTRYLHLKSWPLVNTGRIVDQGALLGYMGKTGKDSYGNPTSTGVHLHFGIRYNDDGSSSVPELTKVIMEGLILKSYQTESRINRYGVPTGVVRCYQSNNTPY